MPRRVSLPAADDLFRPTAVPEEVRSEPAVDKLRREPAEPPSADRPADGAPVQDGPGARPTTKQPSGRVRHDEKMTVYVTAEELLELEQTRLRLRSQGIAVDRGRLVREAVALALADFEANGEDSMLVRRLTDS